MRMDRISFQNGLTMGNCKDCSFWEHHHDVWNKEWDACRIDWVDYSEKISENSAAIYADASDDSGLDAGLKTGPMFGCVRFSPKC